MNAAPAPPTSRRPGRSGPLDRFRLLISAACTTVLAAVAALVVPGTAHAADTVVTTNRTGTDNGCYWTWPTVSCNAS